MIASCIGFCFDFSTLKAVCDNWKAEVGDSLNSLGINLPLSMTGKDLDECLTNNLLNYGSGSGSSPSFSGLTKLRFSHDKVYQAAYILWGQDWNASDDMLKVHYHIGKTLKNIFKVPALLSGSSNNLALEAWVIYDIAQHFNIASRLIAQESELNELVDLNIRACEEALKVCQKK